jgi:hypothetical protein
MLEILLLYFLCKKMGSLLRDKGWKPLFMQIAVVLGWFGSMFVGAIAYSFYVAMTKGPEAVDNMGFEAYPWVLLSAALGVSCVFIVAWMLPDRLNANGASAEVSFADR